MSTHAALLSVLILILLGTVGKRGRLELPGEQRSRGSSFYARPSRIGDGGDRVMHSRARACSLGSVYPAGE